MIHDVDYPLDVPTTSGTGTTPTGGGTGSFDTSSFDTSTTAFPAAGGADFTQFDTSNDPATPLPFGDQPTTIDPAPASEISRRGTTDLGLFILRLTVGVLLALRGLQKLFGLFGGPGIDGFAATLTDAGFEQARLLAIAGGSVELIAGVMLVIGLATPVAAAGLLGLVGLGIAIQLTGGESVALLGETTRGLEPSVLYVAALLALLFAGPGRWSADRKWAWSHRPRFSGVVWIVVVLIVVGLVWYLLNGSNPLTSISDSAPVTAG